MIKKQKIKMIDRARENVGENSLQKKNSETVKEKAQYVLAFGVVATMLLVAKFPMFVIIFFGVFTYFLWKTFTQPSVSGIHKIFEFYIASNNILRDDERRWFGYEIQNVIAEGERILHKMHGAPPLVYFALGALYNKIGNHKAAVTHLGYVLENESADEANYFLPTADLTSYVRVLREVEAEPTKHPLTFNAVRALERARRTRGKAILENSRRALEAVGENLVATNHQLLPNVQKTKNDSLFAPRDVEMKENPNFNPQPENDKHSSTIHFLDMSEYPVDTSNTHSKTSSGEEDKNKTEYHNRKPITEVLRDIYDD